MSSYCYLNYRFDALTYSLQTDINVGVASDGRSILDRIGIGAEVTRDELVQFVRRAYSAARRCVALTSCRTVQEVASSVQEVGSSVREVASSVHRSRTPCPTAHSAGSGGARPRAPLAPTPSPPVAPTPSPPVAPAPGQAGGSGWARGYTPPPPQYILTPDPSGQYGGYSIPQYAVQSGAFALFKLAIVDFLVETNIICHAGTFVEPAGVFSPHEDVHEDVDLYFAEAPGDADQRAAEPAPVDVLSVEQLSGPPVITQVESTPLGPRISRAPERLSLSGPRPRHPALRKPKRGRLAGRGPGVGRGDDGAGAAGGAAGGQ